MTNKEAIEELKNVDTLDMPARLCEAHYMSIKALEQIKWIPVSERLPEKNVEVLATTIWGAITMAERYSANDFFIHEGTTNADIEEVLAWMPLPTPYEPQESEDKE